MQGQVIGACTNKSLTSEVLSLEYSNGALTSADDSSVLEWHFQSL